MSRCALHGPACQGRLDWHHAVKQQRIRRGFKHGAYRLVGDVVWRPIPRDERSMDGVMAIVTLETILADTRNRVWLCRTHHELVHNGRVRVELPASVWAFAEEFGFTAQLENDIARAA